MKKNLLAFCLLILSFLAVSAPGFSAVLNVQAFVDGRSQLVIQGNYVRWQHFDYDAPGWLNPGYEPTYLNSTAWFPWPADSLDSHSHCNGCYSAWYSNLSPALAAAENPVGVTVISPGPGQRPDGTLVWVVQQPTAANGYTAIVEFDDNASGGGWDYNVNITYSGAEARSIPTLSEWGLMITFLLLAGAAIWMIRRRQTA